MAFNSKKHQKQLEKQLQNARKSALEKERQRKEQERAIENEELQKGLTIKEKFDMIKNTTNNSGKTMVTADREINLNERKDEIFLEAPLPISLATEHLPIEWIKDGIIKTQFNSYVKVMEVMPTNFLLKSAEDQALVIYNFEQYLKSGPSYIQMKSMAKKTDLSRYLAKVDEKMKAEENEACRIMQEDYKQLLKRASMQGTISRRFFFIFKYKKTSVSAESEEEIINDINNMASRTISGLAECGNEVLVMDDEDASTTVEKILFDILNRKKNSYTDYETRKNDVYAWYDINYGEEAASRIPVREFVGPAEIDFSHSSYMKIDNTYYDFFFIRGNGYPMAQPGGWLSMIVNAGEGVDLDFFAFKQSKKQMLDVIGRKLRTSYSRLRDMSDTTEEADLLANARQSGYYMKNQMTNNNQDFYYIVTMITVSSSSLKNLQRKKKELMDGLKGKDIQTFSCNMMHEQAFKSYLPLAEVDSAFYNRAKRNCLTNGVAGAYIFTSAELSDDDGIFFGQDENNDSMVIVDLFNTCLLKNANLAILGSSGAGKSYLLQTLALRFRREKIQTFIIAPDKGHEFARACKAIGGTFIDLSPNSGQCINVMEIRKKDSEASDILEGDMLYQSALVEKIQSLHIFFNLLVPDLNDEEDQLIDDALLKVYRDKGIDFDNNTLYKNGKNGEYKEMPILGDVYDILLKKPASVRIANIMNRLVNGSASSFNQQTNVDLDNEYIVINTSNCTGKLLTLATYIGMDFATSKAKENRTKRKAIIIDETWELIGTKSNTKAAEYVLELFKIIRGYGGSAICATQNLKDFFALENGMYGEGIINNCNSKLILYLEPREAKAIKELLELSDAEYTKITAFKQGHCLFSANNSNITLKYQASQMENDLVTTDRKQLERIMRDKKMAQIMAMEQEAINSGTSVKNIDTLNETSVEESHTTIAKPNINPNKENLYNYEESPKQSTSILIDENWEEEWDDTKTEDNSQEQAEMSIRKIVADEKKDNQYQENEEMRAVQHMENKNSDVSHDVPEDLDSNTEKNQEQPILGLRFAFTSDEETEEEKISSDKKEILGENVNTDKDEETSSVDTETKEEKESTSADSGTSVSNEEKPKHKEDNETEGNNKDKAMEKNVEKDEISDSPVMLSQKRKKKKARFQPRVIK